MGSLPPLPRRPAAAVGGREEEEGHVQTQVLDEQGGWTGKEVGVGVHRGTSDVTWEPSPISRGIISHFVRTSSGVLSGRVLVELPG